MKSYTWQNLIKPTCLVLNHCEYLNGFQFRLAYVTKNTMVFQRIPSWAFLAALFYRIPKPMIPTVEANPQIMLHIHEIVQTRINTGSISEMGKNPEMEMQVLPWQLHKGLASEIINHHILPSR